MLLLLLLLSADQAAPTCFGSGAANTGDLAGRSLGLALGSGLGPAGAALGGEAGARIGSVRSRLCCRSSTHTC